MIENEFLIKEVSGVEILPFVEDLAQLRIQVFYEFPYLYDGDLDYERQYLKTYVHSPKSIAILVFQQDRLVGASTGLPLLDETPEFQKPFLEKSFDLEKIFYFGESIILNKARGKKIGHSFFERREAHAQKVVNRLEYTCFCAVERPRDHSLRPLDYRPLHEFWQRLGYKREESLQCQVAWKDRDKHAEDMKDLTFWLKSWKD